MAKKQPKTHFVLINLGWLNLALVAVLIHESQPDMVNWFSLQSSEPLRQVWDGKVEIALPWLLGHQLLLIVWMMIEEHGFGRRHVSIALQMLMIALMQALVYRVI